ncbi:MAG: cbb3-type cytochrome c oxidase subunit I [Candidatus Velamenicoccus archaeovorus]
MAEVQAPPLVRPEPRGRGLVEWLTTTDHKKIGILYLISSLSFFVVAGIFALLMRTELARPGTQILSTRAYNLWILGLIIVGTASILGAINFIVTILRMRAPGMSMMRMPAFCWSVLATSLLVVLAAPVLTAALAMLFADRRLGTVFFDASRGGSPLLYQNVFWFFGHPEVYMLVLVAWGMISEILPVFSGKPLWGYRGVVLAFLLVTALSFTVWAHHMFVTGAVELPFFAVTTEMISIPTGVLFFNWLATLWKGKLRFEPPMLFALGFVAMFLIGGIDGVWMASPAMDFAIHDTYWVVAHIHYVLFGGTVFGIMAGMYYWFPKMSGRFLSRKIGVWQFWIQLIGFNLTFFPMHLLGLKGMPRRIADYGAGRGWTGLNTLASIGAYVIGVAMVLFFVNVFVSLRKPKDAPADAWGSGNSLEWATSSPPPAHNFDTLPEVRSGRPVYDMRKAAASGGRAT